MESSEPEVRTVATLEQIEEWERLGQAVHDGEASWGQLTTALEEAVDEVKFLRSELKYMLERTSFTRNLPKEWGFED